MKRVCAIDPGSEQSAVIMWNVLQNRILYKEIQPNDEVLLTIYSLQGDSDLALAIEMVSCYGMPVGKTVFETVLWIGRFVEAYRRSNDHPLFLVNRRDIKMHFCNAVRAKDSNIRQAMIDRFGPPGTKKEPGKMYGMKKDLWQALALAVFIAETKEEE